MFCHTYSGYSLLIVVCLLIPRVSFSACSVFFHRTSSVSCLSCSCRILYPHTFPYYTFIIFSPPCSFSLSSLKWAVTWTRLLTASLWRVLARMFCLYHTYRILPIPFVFYFHYIRPYYYAVCTCFQSVFQWVVIFIGTLYCILRESCFMYTPHV